MQIGTIEYFGAHHGWFAQFDTGNADKFGSTIACGRGPNPYWAEIVAMKVAEDAHGWHGTVKFVAVQHD